MGWDKALVLSNERIMLLYALILTISGLRLDRLLGAVRGSQQVPDGENWVWVMVWKEDVK